MPSILKAFFKLSIVLLILLAAIFWWTQSGSVASNEVASTITHSPTTEPQTALRQLTVVTYNIGYLSGLTNNESAVRPQELFENNLKSVVSLIEEIQPDILALQEVDFASQRSYDINQLNAIATQTGFPVAARAITWDKHFVPFPPGNPKNYFGRILSGQAVLSTLPLLAHERVELPRPSLPWYRDAFYLDRVAQVTSVDIGQAQPIIVINVHLDHEFPDTRREQLKQVATLYRQYADIQPVLLLGDFNSVPTEEDVIYGNDLALTSLLDEPHIAEAFAGQPKEATLTYRADTPDRKLDHVFYNKNFITLLNARIVAPPENPSDHRALLVTLQLH